MHLEGVFEVLFRIAFVGILLDGQVFTDDEGPLRSEFQVAHGHFVEVVLRPPKTRY